MTSGLRAISSATRALRPCASAVTAAMLTSGTGRESDADSSATPAAGSSRLAIASAM